MVIELCVQNSLASKQTPLPEFMSLKGTMFGQIQLSVKPRKPFILLPNMGAPMPPSQSLPITKIPLPLDIST